MRFEWKIREKGKDNLMKKCWVKKEQLYSRKKEKFYNRNGWGMKAIKRSRDVGIEIEKMILDREKDIQKQIEDSRIRGEGEARCNKRYNKFRNEIR